MKLYKKSLLFWTKFKLMSYQFFIYSLCSSVLLLSDPALAQQGGGLLQTLVQGFMGSRAQQQQQQAEQQRQIYQQQMQQQALAKHNAEMQAQGQLISSLAPQIQPARYFSNCTLPFAKSSFPLGACEIPRTERNQERDIIPVSFTDYQKAISFKALANNYVSFYEQLMSTAQNSASPVGLQCLDESKEKTNTNILDRINYLRTVITEMNKNNQNFRDNNIQYIEAIKKHNTMLDGKGDLTKNDVSGKFKELFGKGSCLDVLKSAELNGIGGLKALRDGVASREKVASQYSTSASKYKSEVEAIIAEAQKDAKNRGIEAWLANPNESSSYMTKAGQFTKFGALPEILTYEKKRLEAEIAQVKKELSDIPSANVKVPAMDLNFKDNLKKLSESRMIGGFMRQCLLSPTSFQIGSTASLDDVIMGVRMLITNEQGSTKPTYIRMAKEIVRQYKLKGEESTDSLIAQLAKLDNEFAGTVGIISNNPSSGLQEHLSLSTYVKNLREACKQNLSNTSSNPNALSTQIAEATQALKKLEMKHDSFTGEVMQAIRDRILNCNGTEYKPNGSSCSEQTFELSQPSFCIKHAETCAKNTLSCDSKIKEQIVYHQSERARVADSYNRGVEQFITVNNAEVQKLKDRVLEDMEFMKRYFPGANYTFPENLFVSMPEPVDTPYGVMLRGGTSLQATLDNVGKQVEKLIGSMEDQREQVMLAIDKYIDNQRQAMDENHGKWEKLLDKCTDYEKNYIDSEIARANAQQKAQAEAQAKQQEQLAEQQEKIAEAQKEDQSEAEDFCTRFGQFQSNAKFDNPGPACDMAETLFKDAGEVSKIVSSEAIAAINEFYNYCQTIQSEGRRRDRSSSTDDEDDSETVTFTPPELIGHCNDSEGAGIDSLFNRVKNHYMEQRLPQIDLSEEDFLEAISKKASLEAIESSISTADYQSLETLLYLNPSSDIKTRDPDHLSKTLGKLEESLDALKATIAKADATRKPELEDKLEKLKKFKEKAESKIAAANTDESKTDLCLIEEKEMMAKAYDTCLGDEKFVESCIETNMSDQNLPKEIASTFSKRQKGIDALYQNARTIASSSSKERASSKLIRLGEKVDDVRCSYVAPNSRQSSGNNFLDNIFTPNNNETKGLQRILDETR